MVHSNAVGTRWLKLVRDWGLRCQWRKIWCEGIILGKHPGKRNGNRKWLQRSCCWIRSCFPREGNWRLKLVGAWVVCWNLQTEQGASNGKPVWRQGRQLSDYSGIQNYSQRNYMTVGEICGLEITWKDKEYRMKVGQKGSGSTGVMSRGNAMGGWVGSENLGQSKLLAVVADFQCLEWDQTFWRLFLLQGNIPMPVGYVNTYWGRSWFI